MIEQIHNPSVRMQLIMACEAITPSLLGELSDIKEVRFGMFPFKWGPDSAHRFATLDGIESQLREFTHDVGLVYFVKLDKDASSESRFQIVTMPVRLNAR